MKIGEMSVIVQGCSGEYRIDVREVYKGISYRVTLTEKPAHNNAGGWVFQTTTDFEQDPLQLQWTVAEKDLFGFLSKIWDRIATCQGFYGL